MHTVEKRLQTRSHTFRHNRISLIHVCTIERPNRLIIVSNPTNDVGKKNEREKKTIMKLEGLIPN